MSLKVKSYLAEETNEEICRKDLLEGSEGSEYLPKSRKIAAIEDPSYEIHNWVKNKQTRGQWGSPIALAGKPVDVSSFIVWHIEDRPQSVSAKDISKKFTELEFKKLSEKWKDESSYISLLRNRFKLESYQQIIEMGERVIPFLLKDLVISENYWFVALESITKHDEVKPEHFNNFRKMAKDWIDWGKKKSYI